MRVNRLLCFRSYWFPFLFLLLVSIKSFSQESFFFEHLTADNGLLANDVFSVFEDRQGYIWIGSVGGLQRFDGYDFLDYTYDPEGGMPESSIRHIIETTQGEIWAGIRGGGILRIKNNKLLSPFTHEEGNSNSLAGNYVESILEDENRGFWIATDQGLDYLKDGKFTHHRHNPQDEHSLSNNIVYALHFDENGNLWVGTKEGLNLYLGDGKFRRFLHDAENESSLSANFIHGITSDNEGNLWLAIVQGGLNKIDLSDYSVVRYKHDPDDPSSLGNNIVLDVKYSAKDSSLWVGTWGGGLNKFVDGKFIRYKHAYGDETTILSDNLEEILIDKRGNLWLATIGGGVSRFSESKLRSYLYKDYKEKGMLTTSSLKSIMTTKDGAIWMATHLGVNRIKDDKFEAFVYDSADPKFRLSSPSASVIYEDSKKRIWIGCYQSGADMIENGVITRFIYDKSNPDGIGSDEISDICEDSNGNIWFGTNTNGVSVYDGEKFVHYKGIEGKSGGLGHNRTSALFPGQNSEVWVATFRGLSHFKDGTFTNYVSSKDPGALPKNKLIDVVMDHRGDVWVGYIGGVARLDIETGNFKQYDSKDGIGDNIVEELEVDGNGIVWVGTHSGLAKYIPEYDAFINYGKEDGLINEQVLRINYDKWNDELYIGTPSGYFVMNEYDLKPYSGNSNLYLTGFFLVDNGENKQIDLGSRNEITLDHNQNSFLIRYSTLSGEISPKNQFSYKMMPFNDDWVFAGTKNYLEYTYLNPGTYKLQVKLSAALNEDQIKSLTIHILPPWWGTWWFRLMLILGLLLFVFLIIKWRSYRIETQKRKLNVEVRKKTGQLKDAQSRLIESEKMASVGLLTAGIAHEINNPLNFIHGSGEALDKYLKKKFPGHEEEFEPLLDALNLGVSRVDEIIKSLNRFNHQSTENKEKCDIKLIINNCLIMLQNQLKNRVSIIKNYTNDEYDLIGFEGELHQVFLNILVNASQAIQGEGSISITTKIADENMLLIEIQDTGGGIEKEDLAKVTSPFYTTKPPGSGTGLGMSIGYRIIQDHKGAIHYDSEKGKGTKVSVILPLASN